MSSDSGQTLRDPQDFSAGDEVVAIQLSLEDKQVLQGFRTVVETGEKSHKALKLTEKVCYLPF